MNRDRTKGSALAVLKEAALFLLPTQEDEDMLGAIEDQARQAREARLLA